MTSAWPNDTAPSGEEEVLVESSTADSIERLIYVFCLLLGGPLNVSSLISIVKRYTKDPHYRSQFLLLRMHLNIADLITLFVYTLTQIIWLSTYQWYGGDILCRICKFFYTFSFYLNSFVNSGIAVDRACNTYNIHSRKALERAMDRVRLIIIVVYIGASLFSMPQLFIFRVFRHNDDFKQCSPIWTITRYEVMIQQVEQSESGKVLDDRQKQLLDSKLDKIKQWEMTISVVHLLVVFWIPSFIITLSYVVVIYRLKTFFTKKGYSTSQGQEAGNNAPPHLKNIITESFCPKSTEVPRATSIPSVQLLRSRASEVIASEIEQNCCLAGASHTRTTLHRATKIAKCQAAVILLTYLTLWTPYNLMALISILVPTNSSFDKLLYWTLPFLNALIVINTVINPIIYGIFEQRKSPMGPQKPSRLCCRLSV